MNPRRFVTLLLTLITLAFAAPAAASVNEMNPRGAPAPTAVQTQPRGFSAAARTPHGSRADEQRYAAREAQSKNAKKFRGGEPVVVITATAAIIILLGVIIILLVT
jgi:hypothetical protein